MNYKRFIFPAFEYNDFQGPISFKGGQVSWKLFHNVFEKDNLLEANLRKAPKITHKVLHPGNCKQKVPVILAILHGLHQQLVLVIFMRKKWGRMSLDTLMLSPDSREVAIHIAGYTAKNIWKKSRVAPAVKCMLRVP